MTEKPLRRFELCPERLKTLKDVKKILKALQIRIDTHNSLYEELKEYFVIEVVPRGYAHLTEVLDHKEIEKMTYEEMAQKINELGLLNNEQTKND
jgi:hypothetical protein